MNRTTTTHGYIHKVGDGRHLINDNFQVFPNGSWQQGDSSDICIILNAHRLCQAFDLQPIWELWTQAYPEDPMEFEDAQTILAEAHPYTAPFDATVPDDRADVLKDLRAIQLDVLADLLSRLLVERHVIA